MFSISAERGSESDSITNEDSSDNQIGNNNITTSHEAIKTPLNDEKDGEFLLSIIYTWSIICSLVLTQTLSNNMIEMS